MPDENGEIFPLFGDDKTSLKQTTLCCSILAKAQREEVNLKYVLIKKLKCINEAKLLLIAS